MPEYLSPGVYIEEFDSAAVPIGGVGTSTAGFVGLAQRGNPAGIPELVTSYADFQRKFGGYLSEKKFGNYRFLAYSIESFFVNGGSRCFVMRAVPEDAKASVFNNELFDISAKNPGVWGDRILVATRASSKSKSPILEDLSETGQPKYRLKNATGFNEGDIIRLAIDDNTQVRKIKFVQGNEIVLDEALEGDVVDNEIVPKKLVYTSEFNLQVSYGDEVEEYANVSFNSGATNFIETAISRSNLISVNANEDIDVKVIEPFDLLKVGESEKALIALSGGSDGSVGAIGAEVFAGADNGPGKRTGIMSFMDVEEVSIMAVPGIIDPAVQVALVAHCENTTSRVAVLDMEQELSKVGDIKAARDLFDSSYAAVYHPWLKVNDPLEKKIVSLPPSGAMIGIYARTDNSRGVHKAPANEVVRGCIGLDCQYNMGEQDILNPIGVNLIRFFTGQGIRVWGARTLSSNALWRYINVRRLFIFIEQSVKASTNWVVFEPNDVDLWNRVKRSLDTFLTGVWRSGALVGSSPSEAFFVRVDRTTMTQDDIDNGRLVCIVGIAAVKPAEFVIFKFTQKTSGGEE